MALTLTAVAPPSNSPSPSTPGMPALNPFIPGPCPSLEDAFYRRMPYAHQGASGGRIVQTASKARFVVCRYDAKISIWHVERQIEKVPSIFATSHTAKLVTGDDSSLDGWEKVLDMELKVDTTLVTSAIAEDGKWLAVSDAYETKLFRLVTEVREYWSPSNLLRINEPSLS